jgi:hypothetical protein
MTASIEAGPNILRSLGAVYASTWSPAVRQVLYSPARFGAGHDLEATRSHLASLLPSEIAHALLPLAVVDEASLACTVVRTLEVGGVALRPGLVVRLFLTGVDARHQLAVLDTDPYRYVESLEEELAARGPGSTGSSTRSVWPTNRPTWSSRNGPVISSSARSASPART